MNITILCSESDHPINGYLEKWIIKNCNKHEINLVRNLNELYGGDILFLVSCNSIVSKKYRDKYKFSLVLHASDLPKGRGWSPHIWEICAGKNILQLCLLNAEDAVDSGDIWLRKEINIPEYSLWDEINHILFKAELELMDEFLRNNHTLLPLKQDESMGLSYHPRRLPINSRIDPKKSIESQFNLIRVADPKRYPAYFEMYGCYYRLILERIDGENI